MNPSILITPNSVKAGKLYSIVPTDGAGDLDVVRATTATYVGADGLIKTALANVPRLDYTNGSCPSILVEPQRTNLLLRSEEFDNASWSKSNATITANTTISPDGNNNADTYNVVSLGANFIYQIPSLTTGSYSISVYAKKGSSNIIRLFNVSSVTSAAWFDLNLGQVIGTVNGGTASIENSGNGWYRCVYKGTSVTSGFTGIGLSDTANSATASIGSSVYIWGAQLEQGSTATEYIPTTSVVRTRFAGITQDGSSASNIPRLDYTNGSCPSILVEPQRTNLVVRSQEFDNASWGKIIGASIVQNTAISPSGTLTADTLNFNTQIGSRVEQSVSLSDLGSYTFSFYAKSDSNKIIGIRTGISGSATINITVTTEWQRFSITQTLSVAGLAYPQIRTIDTSGGFIYIWGAQLEVGSNATSYIPTVASAVTRNADVISKTGIADLIGQTEGTIFCELNLKNLLGNQARRIIAISNNNSASENIQITFTSSLTNTIRAVIASGGNFPLITSSQITSLGKIKIALAYSTTDVVFYVNGIKQGVDLGATTKPVMNFISLGSLNNADFLNDNIDSALLFNTRLTNSELQQLTTI